MPPPPPPPRRNPSNQWRFTWETLAHIPTLRLYLFHPDTDPSARCRTLTASLRPDKSLLLVCWIDDDTGSDVQLRVPVPKVLIDPTRPPDCLAKQDHIEVKLALALPVDHPLVAGLQGVLDPAAEETDDRLLPLTLGSDLKSLSSGDVHFYCKACSAKLTGQPLGQFVEMPSVNWREIADNWFGTCCCSFGGVSEKLVSQYMKTYDCSKGTCLLDGASVILCKEDLEGYIFEPNSNGYEDDYKICLGASDNVTELMKEGICGNVTEAITDACANSSSVANNVVSKDSDPEEESFEYKNGIDPLACPLLSSTDCCGNIPRGSDYSVSSGSTHLDETQYQIDAYMLKLNLNCCSGILERPISRTIEELSSDNQCHFFADRNNDVLNLELRKSGYGTSVMPKKIQQPADNSEPERSHKWIHNSSLGSGFIIRNSNVSNDVEWVQFSCRKCSSPLGSYPSLQNTNVPLDGGVRLFKCYISTSIPTCGANDIFRKHTLDRVFVNSLLESAEDELSFRTIVRDLRSGSVMLQIVLLNSKAWCSSGYCFENAILESFFETQLQPIVKVLFSDCTTATEADSRITKEWLTKTHVEEVYMMTHQIEELTKHLKVALERLPLSCSSLQGMYLSSLGR